MIDGFVEDNVGAALLGDDRLIVEGDEVRLRQILVNFLSNAVKFTEAGEIGVHISTFDVDERTWVTVEVRDTGIGIPQAAIEKLFKSFSQVDASTTRKYGGTGLGLAITRRLVDAMGGRIWAESEVGVEPEPGAGGGAGMIGAAAGRCSSVMVSPTGAPSTVSASSSPPSTPAMLATPLSSEMTI